MLNRHANGTQPLHRLRGEMDRLFADAFGDFAWSDPFGRRGTPAGPALNVWEDDRCFHAEAEVPGISMSDIEVVVAGDELTLKGERKAPTAENAAFHRRERSVGAFSRTLRLPVELEADKVEATLRDGVLTITMPKAPAARARRIEVKTKSE